MFELTLITECAYHKDYRVSLRSSSKQVPSNPSPNGVCVVLVARASNRVYVLWSSQAHVGRGVRPLYHGFCHHRTEANPSTRLSRSSLVSTTDPLTRRFTSTGLTGKVFYRLPTSNPASGMSSRLAGTSAASNQRALASIPLQPYYRHNANMLMIQTQVHLRLPCYDFCFL